MSDDPHMSEMNLQRSRSEVAGLLALQGMHLDDEALWVQPDADLEASILAAITDDDPSGPSTSRSIWSARSVRWLAPLAAAAALLALFVASNIRTEPDWTVALDATDAAPGASALVSGWNEDSGTRVGLEIEGLDPAPEGFVYELWFSDEAIHISAGTFHGTGDGVTLWAGVARSDFPRVWITLEPIDDDPAPAVNLLDTAALDA